MKFKRNAPLEWADPDNWSSGNGNRATPHAERIPCVHDTAAFNPGKSFSVIVPDVPISIGAVEYGNQVSSAGRVELFRRMRIMFYEANNNKNIFTLHKSASVCSHRRWFTIVLERGWYSKIFWMDKSHCSMCNKKKNPYILYQNCNEIHLKNGCGWKEILEKLKKSKQNEIKVSKRRSLLHNSNFTPKELFLTIG